MNSNVRYLLLPTVLSPRLRAFQPSLEHLVGEISIMTDDLQALHSRIAVLERADEKLRRELDEVAHLGVDNAFLLENNARLRRELRELRARFGLDEEPSAALAADDPKPRAVRISDVTLGGRYIEKLSDPSGAGITGESP